MKRLKLTIAIAFIAFATHVTEGASVILNEYNGVSGTNQLDGGDGADSFFGTIDGNGDNWFELLVIDDQVDMRGWQFVWQEDEDVGNNETAMGTITLSQDSVWSGVRSGSIVTVIESPNAGGEGNTKTDTSYNPFADDWWINVATQEEHAKGEAGLASTVTNDGNPGDFSTGKDDWTLTILDAAGATIFGPAGEGLREWAGNGVGSEEGGSLEGPLPDGGVDTLTVADWKAITPDNEFYDDTGSTSFGAANVDFSEDDMVFVTIQDLSALRGQIEPPEGVVGDFDNDGLLTAADIDELSQAVRDAVGDAKYDLDGNGSVDNDDRLFWILDRSVAHSHIGDSNLDREFSSSDFVLVFAAGKYETGEAAGWDQGDWNGDGLFNTSDFVDAFNRGTYEQGPPAALAAVPEPSGLLTVLLGLVACIGLRRRF